MQENVSEKLKSLSTVIAFLGILGSLILGGLVGFLVNLGTGIALALPGVFVSWIGSLVLSGIGQAVGNTEEILRRMGAGATLPEGTYTASYTGLQFVPEGTTEPATTPSAPTEVYRGKLVSIEIPHGATQIEMKEFAYRADIGKVSIPSTVTSIGYGAFIGCTRLVRIQYAGTKKQWATIEKGELWNEETGPYTLYCADGLLCKGDS